jgi:hypothetical protein
MGLCHIIVSQLAGPNAAGGEVLAEYFGTALWTTWGPGERMRRWMKLLDVGCWLLVNVG